MPIAILKLGFAVATVLLMLSSAIFALVRLPRRFFGGPQGVPDLDLRMNPLLATLSGGAVFFLIWEVSGEAFARDGGPIWSGPVASMVLYAAHGVFAFFAIRGLLRAVRRHRSSMSRLVWWHAFATSLALTVCAVYLSYGGLRWLFT